MQKIVVNKFQQIIDVEVDVKRIILLIGDQASGKSTLAKLIYFFKSLKEDYFNLIYEYASTTRNNQALSNLFINKIQDKFRIYFGYTSELDDDFEITFFYNYDENNKSRNRYLKLFKQKSLQVKFDNDYLEELLSETRELVKIINNYSKKQTKTTTIGNYMFFERTKSRFIDELKQRIDLLFNDEYTSMFFPDGRSLTISYPQQFRSVFFKNLAINDNPKSVDLRLMYSFILYSDFLYDYFNGKSFDLLINNLSEPEIISKAVSQFILNKSEYILKGKYDNTDGIEKIIYDTTNNKSVPLNIASSGQKESIRLVQDILHTIYKKQKSFKIIEEPEAHLYPQSQKALIELLFLATNITKSQLIITTHSPYILNISNNLLMYDLVKRNKPERLMKVQQHFETVGFNEDNERISISRDDFNVHALTSNTKKASTAIIDSETGLIGENYLDKITEELNEDFDVLYSINFQNNEK